MKCPYNKALLWEIYCCWCSSCEVEKIVLYFASCVQNCQFLLHIHITNKWVEYLRPVVTKWAPAWFCYFWALVWCLWLATGWMYRVFLVPDSGLKGLVFYQRLMFQHLAVWPRVNQKHSAGWGNSWFTQSPLTDTNMPSATLVLHDNFIKSI